MTKIYILHITDVHFGQSGYEEYGNDVRNRFYRDIGQLIHDHNLGLDLILFSGDIAFSGSKEQYEQADEFMYDLVEQLSDSVPGEISFLAVPGNHDVRRPGYSTTVKALEKLWDREMEEKLYNGDAQEIQTTISAAFSEYKRWVENPLLNWAPHTFSGRYPGEFKATYEKEGKKLGILGLNTSFRHFSDEIQAGDIRVSMRQVNAIVGGNLASWSHDHDFGICIAHHPESWLGPEENILQSIFSPTNQMSMYICGHTHEEGVDYRYASSDNPYISVRGRSLFGLEQFYNGPQKESRNHGYYLIELEFLETGQKKITIWPRTFKPSLSGNHTFVPSAEIGLQGTLTHTTPILLPSRARKVSNDATLVKKDTGVQKDLDVTFGTTIIDRASEGVTQKYGTDSYSAQIATLKSHIESGNFIGLLGERVAQDAEGRETIPLLEVRKNVTRLLGGGNSFSRAAFADIIRLGHKRNKNETERILAQCLGNPYPEEISQLTDLLEMPWKLFVDMSSVSAVEATRRQHKNVWKLISANADKFYLPDGLEAIRLRLVGDIKPTGSYPLDLLHHDYFAGVVDERTKWIAYTMQQMAIHPAVFLSDDPASSMIVDWVRRLGRSSDSRPDVYMVAPQIDEYTESILMEYDVQLIRMSVNEFCDTFAGTDKQHNNTGWQKRARVRNSIKGAPIISLEQRMHGTRAGSRDFLFGRSPLLGDIADGYAASLTSINDLINRLKSNKDRPVLITGTAGSGKTTLLYQVALNYMRNGKRVFFIDAHQRPSPPNLISMVEASPPDLVVIDDFDIYGQTSGSLIERIREKLNPGAIVVMACRTTRIEILGSNFRYDEFSMPEVNENDAQVLVLHLREKHAIADQRLSDADVVNLILRESGGMMLVSMMQATSGTLFPNIIESECKQLSRAQLLVYGCICVVSAELESIHVDHILQAMFAPPEDVARAIQTLHRSKLIQRDGIDSYTSRHRVVAESVRAYLGRRKLLVEVLKGTLWALAASASRKTTGKQRHDSDRRTMVRLINHSYLKQLDLTVEDIRSIYDTVEEILYNDFHYWLQRGSFELEKGDVESSIHALVYASTLEQGEDDHKVLTEYAYARLVANRDRIDPLSIKLCSDAITDLLKVIRTRGTDSPHTIDILSRHGVPWLVKGHLSQEDAIELATDCLHMLNVVSSVDRKNRVASESRPVAVDNLEKFLAG